MKRLMMLGFLLTERREGLELLSYYGNNLNEGGDYRGPGRRDRSSGFNPFHHGVASK